MIRTHWPLTHDRTCSWTTDSFPFEFLIIIKIFFFQTTHEPDAGDEDQQPLQQTSSQQPSKKPISFCAALRIPVNIYSFDFFVF